MPIADDFDAEAPVIDAIRGGDRFAFDDLVRRWNRWVRGIVFGVIARPEDVDDVTQQVWSSVWTRIGELRDTRAWKSWLFRLARNAAVDAGREMSRRRQRIGPLGENVDHPALTASPEVVAMLDERQRKVIDAIRSLPPLYREPFALRHMNGWSYQQIADLLQMPVDSIETRLVRARRLLRDALKDIGNSEQNRGTNQRTT
ncbi:MAG: sigma-70 family RNA polymerase sigma factor [Planctomycetes bacterium]|nr:sigma-70 family RNA polymerase sigma factor [Planctomycetota bacterium]